MYSLNFRNFFEWLTTPLRKRSKRLEVMYNIQANKSAQQQRRKGPTSLSFSNAKWQRKWNRSPLLALVSLQVGLAVFFVIQGKK